MNKRKNYSYIILNIFLILICAFLAFVVFVFYILKQYDITFSAKVEYIDDEDNYKIVLEQSYEDAIIPIYNIGPRVFVGKKVDEKWIYKKLFKVPISTEDTFTRTNYSIDWIDGGAIIKIKKVKDERDRIYRIYWEDVF